MLCKKTFAHATEKDRDTMNKFYNVKHIINSFELVKFHTVLNAFYSMAALL